MPSPLPLITALARAGALGQAKRLFAAGGYEARIADPAALAVKGRLLKDDGLRSAGADRQALFREAASAYAAAHALDPQPYLLINIATLSLLAGDREQAEGVARDVLVKLDAPAPLPETPYWLAATRSEALLILGRRDDANNALHLARTADPDGWSDHASTLRQLGLILAARGEDASWLEHHRPPKSLHYAGHLGVGMTGSDALRTRIEEILSSEHIGFGYGALAAGADIMVAEALIARGAALHITLPTMRSTFIAQSIAPFGSDWLARFEACAAAAASMQEATGTAGDYEPLATALAANIAMGGAILNARRLESRAAQLLIIDEGDAPFGDGASTARDGAAWQKTGFAQHIISWPRHAPVAPSSTRTEGDPDRRLLALLHVRFDNANSHGVEEFWSRAARLAEQPLRWQEQGNGRMLAFDDTMAAANFAQRLHRLDPPDGAPPSIAGHYGLLHATDQGIAGFALYVLDRVAAATFPGTTTVSETFATALALATDANLIAEHLGDTVDMRLFGLQ